MFKIYEISHLLVPPKKYLPLIVKCDANAFLYFLIFTRQFQSLWMEI